MTIKQAISKRNKLWVKSAKLGAQAQEIYTEGDKLHAEANDLDGKGDKPCAEGDRLQAEGDNLYAIGRRFWAEGDTIHTEGDLVVINAVIEEHGPEAIIEFDGEKVKVSCTTTIEY